MPNERELAAGLVNAVLLDGRSLTSALLDPPLAAAATGTLAAARSLAYGTLRQAGRLRLFLDRLAGRAPDPDRLLGYLLVGLFELDAQTAPSYAVVNETVAGAARIAPRARGFVNAVLRNCQRRQQELSAAADADPAARWNLPLWWIGRLQAEYPDRWQSILEVQNLHPPMTLRVNRRRVGREDYLERMQERGMPARPVGSSGLLLERAVPVADLPDFDRGLVSVQDLGAQFAAPLLDAADGMRVLDACSAPGGKTAHLLELFDLDLTALDYDRMRLQRVRANLDRLGLNAHLLAADAGRPMDWWDGLPFDRILLDAPCTASGVVRRHPDARWLKRGEDAQQLAAEQTRLLNALWPLLKADGKMLYATCSLFRVENAGQTAAFLRCQPDARDEPLDLPGGIGGQLLPDEDTDGFFYARFVKA